MNKKFIFTIIFIFIFIIILYGAYIIKKDENITFTKRFDQTSTNQDEETSSSDSSVNKFLNNYGLAVRDILNNPDSFNLANSDAAERAENALILSEFEPPNLNFLFQSVWVDQICKTVAGDMSDGNAQSFKFLCSFVSMEVNNKELQIAKEIFDKSIDKVLRAKSESLDAMSNTFDSPKISSDELKYKIKYENHLQRIESSALKITTDELTNVFDTVNVQEPEIIIEQLTNNYKLALNSEMQSEFFIFLNQNPDFEIGNYQKILSNNYFDNGELNEDIIKQLKPDPEDTDIESDIGSEFWEDKFGLKEKEDQDEFKRLLRNLNEKINNFEKNIKKAESEFEEIKKNGGDIDEYLNNIFKGQRNRLGRRVAPDLETRITSTIARLNISSKLEDKSLNLDLFSKSSSLQDECFTNTEKSISNLERSLANKSENIRTRTINIFKTSLKKFRNSFKPIGDRISEIVTRLSEINFLEIIRNSSSKFLSSIYKIPLRAIISIKTNTVEAVLQAYDFFADIPEDLGRLQRFITNFPDNIEGYIAETWEFISNISSKLLNKIKSMPRATLDAFKKPFENIALEDVQNGFLSVVKTPFALVKILNPFHLIKGLVIQPLIDIVKLSRMALKAMDKQITGIVKKNVEKFIAETSEGIASFEERVGQESAEAFKSFALKNSVNSSKFLKASDKLVKDITNGLDKLDSQIEELAAKAGEEGEEFAVKTLEDLTNLRNALKDTLEKVTNKSINTTVKVFKQEIQEMGKTLGKMGSELSEDLAEEAVDIATEVGADLTELAESAEGGPWGMIAGVIFFIYSLVDLGVEQYNAYEDFKQQNKFQYDSAINSFSDDFNQSLNFMYGDAITNQKLLPPINKMTGPLIKLNKLKFTSFLDETNFNGIDICKIVFQLDLYFDTDLNAQKKNPSEDGTIPSRPLSSLNTPLFNFGPDSINFNILMKNKNIFIKIISPLFSIDNLKDNSQFDLEDDTKDISKKKFIFSLCKEIYDRLLYNQRKYRLILLNRQQQYMNHNNDETYFNKEVFSKDIPKIHNYLLNVYSQKLDYIIQKKVIFYTKIFSINFKYLSKLNSLIDYFNKNKNTNIFSTSNPSSYPIFINSNQPTTNQPTTNPFFITTSTTTTAKGYEFIARLKKLFNLNYNIFYNYKIFDSISHNSQIKDTYNKIKNFIDNKKDPNYKTDANCYVSRPPDWPPSCTPSPTPSPCSSPPPICEDTLNYLGSMLYSVSYINKSISNKEKQLIYIDVLKEYAKENDLIYINLLEDDEQIKYNNTFTGIAYQKYFFNLDNIKKTLTFDFNYIDLDGNYSTYSKTFVINADEFTEYNQTDAYNYLTYWQLGYALEPTMEFIQNLEISFNNQIKNDDFFLGKFKFILKERDDVMHFPPKLNTRKNKVIEMIVYDTNYNYHIELNRDKSDPIAQNIFGYNMSELEILYYGYYDNQIDFEDIFNTHVVSLNENFCNEYKINLYSKEEDDFQNKLMNNLLNNIGKDITNKISPSSPPPSYPFESSTYEDIVREINQTVNPSIRPIRDNSSVNDANSYWYYEEDNYLCVNNKTEKPFDIPSPSNGQLEWKFNTEPINTYDYTSEDNSFENWGNPDFSNSVNFINPGYLTQEDFGGFVQTTDWDNQAADYYKQTFASSQIKDINNQVTSLPDFWNSQGLLFTIPKSIILDESHKPTISCQEQYELNKKNPDFIDYSCEDNSTNNQQFVVNPNQPTRLETGPDGQLISVPNTIPNPNHINCSECFNKIKDGHDVSNLNCGTIPDGEDDLEKSKLWCSNKNNSRNQLACNLKTIQKQELCNPYGAHFNRGWETRTYDDNDITYPNYPMKNIDCDELKYSINKDADVCCTMKSNERSIMSGEDWKLANKVFPQPAPRNHEFDDYIEKNRWYEVDDSQEGFNLMLKLFKSTFNTLKWNPNALDKNQSYSHFSQKEIDNQGKCVNDFIIPKLWCEQPNFKKLNGLHVWPRKYPKGQEKLDTLYQKQNCSPSPTEFLNNYINKNFSISPTPTPSPNKIQKRNKAAKILLNINQDYLPSCSRKPEDNWELLDSWDQFNVGDEKKKGITMKHVDNVRKTYYNFEDLPESPTPGDLYLKWEDNKCKVTEKYCKFYNDERLGQNLLKDDIHLSNNDTIHLSNKERNIFSHYDHEKDECIINRTPNLKDTQIQKYVEDKSFKNINDPDKEPDGIDLIILDKQRRDEINKREQNNNLYIEHKNISDMTTLLDGESIDYGNWMKGEQRSFAGDEDYTDRTSNLLPLD